MIKKFSFRPDLSWDGVAMIVAFVGACLWFGVLSERVRSHDESLRNHQAWIERLDREEAELKAVVNERTQRRVGP